MALWASSGNRTTTAVIQFVISCIIVHRLWKLCLLDLNFLMPLIKRPPPATCGFLNVTEFAIASENVVLPSGVVPAVVYVKDQRIVEVLEIPQNDDAAASVAKERLAEKLNGVRLIDYGSAVISPGLIDVHTHLNEPGRWEWEGMIKGTKAAAAGGITTLIDMPLNSWPATTTIDALKQKKKAASWKIHVDVGFWAGLVPDNAFDAALLGALLDEGALGFKAFMHPSAIQDFPHVNRTHLEAGFRLAKERGVPVLLHAELADYAETPESDPTLYSTYLSSRPRAMEVAAVHMVLDILKHDNSTAWQRGFVSHIVHLSDADLIPELQAAKEQGLPVKVETCPHYLTFAAEDIPAKATKFKCSPPIREKENKERLWHGLKDGVIDLVASDHSPSPPEMKSLEEGNFMTAWGGISGLQYSLPSTWHSMPERGLGLMDLMNWWSWQPALLAGLAHKKGQLAAGYDADIVVWDPQADASTASGYNYHRHKLTPYANMSMKGHVMVTYVRGQEVFNNQKGATKERCGKALLKGEVMQQNEAADDTATVAATVAAAAAASVQQLDEGVVGKDEL